MLCFFILRTIGDSTFVNKQAKNKQKISFAYIQYNYFVPGHAFSKIIVFIVQPAVKNMKEVVDGKQICPTSCLLQMSVGFVSSLTLIAKSYFLVFLGFQQLPCLRVLKCEDL